MTSHPTSNKRLGPSSRRGNETVQTTMLIAITAVVVFGVSYVTRAGLGLSVELFQSAAVLALLAAILGVIGWCGKLVVEWSPQRAEMLIREVLSDGKARRREELLAEAKTRRGDGRFGLFPGSLTDAIARLLANGELVVSENKYYLASIPPAEIKGSAPTPMPTDQETDL